MFKINKILTVVTMIVAMAAPAWAATFDGGPSGTATDWNTAENWDTDAVPTSSNSVTINAKTAEIQSNAPNIGGTLIVNNGGHLIINANLAHDVGNQDVVVIGGIITQNGGDVYFSDDMRLAGATHNLNGGTFYLNDYYRFDSPSLIAITGGSFTVGGSSGASGSYLRIDNGTFKITGDAATLITSTSLEADSGSTLEIVLKDGGITTFDVINNAALPGTLDVTLDAGFVLPTVATGYDLIVAGSLSGAIGTENLPSDDWSLSYVDGTTVRLSYVGSGGTSATMIYWK
jgi:hypothetical protein